MNLKHHTIRYNPSDLKAWTNGRYDVLKDSQASSFIKQILCEKAGRRRRGRIAAGKRGDRRFFGEAVVAAHPSFVHRAGWYASYKWLSAPGWCGSTRRTLVGFHEQFKAALDEYVLNLKQVQERERLLFSQLGGKHAMAPDLWLFTGRNHRFIEVKMPGDSLSDTQLAGLALIATALEATRPVSVEVVSLVADSDISPSVESNVERFQSLCAALKAEWRWREGSIDRSKEHIELRINKATGADTESAPVALVGQPSETVFPVQFLTSDKAALAKVRRELDFYLVEHPAQFPDTGHPWDYAVYHCGTGANMYSSVHWSHVPAGLRLKAR